MVAAAMTETLALRRPARARRRPGRERTMQFQAWRATTARRAIPGESGVREICMRRLEGRAEVAGQRWPAASPDPTPMKQGNDNGPWGGKGAARQRSEEGNVDSTPRLETTYTKLHRLSELAKQNPTLQFTSIA